MTEELCELRFDVPLGRGEAGAQFERGWRSLLARQKMTAIAMPPAEALEARYCLCGEEVYGEHLCVFERYLVRRLAMLPGTPTVAAAPPVPRSEWCGVQIWLSYRAHSLPVLLAKTKKIHHPRGRRR